MESVFEQLKHIDSILPAAALDHSHLDIIGSPGFASAFDVDLAAMTSAAAVASAFGDTTIDAARVAATFIGRVLLDGEVVPGWAPLSGYYDTQGDRTIQLHCNFEHHADGVVALLGCEPTRASVQEAILKWDPLAFESALIDSGLIGAYLRTMEEWDNHPHAHATSALPLLEVTKIGEAAPRTHDGPARVLDCTRVLAGPVASQTFANHGADVLRVGAEHLPHVPMCVQVSGSGKRNAYLDLRDRHDAASFRDLLNAADVWIDSYRSGALAGHGFGVDAAAPGSIVVQINAFDWVGPWGSRRGFDSIIQSTTGIVEAGRVAAGANTPTPLPVQALDYATGLLAAYAAERMRQHQREVGGTWLVRLSLLRTRNWLVGLGGPEAFTPTKPDVPSGAVAEMPSEFGTLTLPLPPSGEIVSAPRPLGSSPANWDS